MGNKRLYQRGQKPDVVFVKEISSKFAYKWFSGSFYALVWAAK
jgi:hypothetical protein